MRLESNATSTQRSPVKKEAAATSDGRQEEPIVQVTEEGVVEKRYITKQGASIVVKIPERRVEDACNDRLKRSESRPTENEM